jgi:CubicO group peptidase (beta-lactamase class C family)
MDNLFHIERRVFLKKMGICIAGTGTISMVPGHLLINNLKPYELPQCSPELQGISSEEILNFVEAAEKTNAGLHSFMIIRHGYVVAEGHWAPYRPDISHWLYSLSKNFTSTAIGFAVQESYISLTDKVVSFFPEDKPSEVNQDLEKMTIRDLLLMASGHGEDTLRPLMASKDGNWVKAFLSYPLKYTPGTRFVYNSGCTYMLSAILQKVTGVQMVDYLQPRLFAPLGIEGAEWDSDPKGINFGAAGLRLKTEDIAKFGQFYLQKGVWKRKRLLNEKWIKEATSFKISNHDTGTPTIKEEDDIKQGYGYHFWLSRPIAQGAYRAEGAFCQFSIIMPAQDAVVAINAEGISTKRVMDLCWEVLLPAMKVGKLPKNDRSEKALRQKLGTLQLIPPKINPSSSLASSLSGNKYHIDHNPMNVQEITFQFGMDKNVFILKDDKAEYSITCGINEWKIGNTKMPGSPTNLLAGVPLYKDHWKVAASSTWKDENTFEMTWRFFETPHYDIVTCTFDKDKLQIVYGNSITRILKQYKDPRPELVGSHIL